MRTRLSVFVVALGLSAYAEEPKAEGHFHREEPKRERVGWRVPDRAHTMEDAGYPQCVSKWAQPGRTGHDFLGYIGGSCLGRRGEGRHPDEGTVGWDFVLFAKRPGSVFLNWCHCKPHQVEIEKTYRTDGGPKVPDVFAIRPAKRLHEKGGKAEE